MVSGELDLEEGGVAGRLSGAMKGCVWVDLRWVFEKSVSEVGVRGVREVESAESTLTELGGIERVRPGRAGSGEVED